MTPVLAIDDPIYGGLTYTELVSDGLFGSAAAPHRADVSDLSFGKFGGINLLSAAFVRSALSDAIVAVIHLRSHENMGRTETPAIVATVQGAQSFWNRPYGDLVSESMDQGSSIVDLRCSVAVRGNAPGPLHAGISFRDFREKFLEKLKVASLVKHRCALHGAWCAASAVFAHRGAFSILPPKISEKEHVK